MCFFLIWLWFRTFLYYFRCNNPVLISHCSVFYCVTTRWGMENANTPSEQPTLLYQCVCSYSLEHHLCHLFWWSVSFRSPQQRWFGVNVANCSTKRVVSIAYICFCFLRSADVHIHSIVNHFVIFLLTLSTYFPLPTSQTKPPTSDDLPFTSKQRPSAADCGPALFKHFH